MTERVDIMNQALSMLGVRDITSPEDDTAEARQMKINYAPARDATLEAHEWSFAILRFTPGQLLAAPEFGAAHAYSIPSDVLRVLTVETNREISNVYFNDPIGSKEQVDWVFEDRKILCDEEVIRCRGLRRVVEEGKFSPLFCMALATQLAFLTAISLTGSAEIQANMARLFEMYIRVAKSRDGLQGRSRRIRQRSLLKVR